MDQEAETRRRKQLFQDYIHGEAYKSKLIERLRVNDACNKKAEARAYAWNLCERKDNPAEGIIFFIENFGWTFDPRPQADPNHLPFILYEYQKELIRDLISHIDSGKDLLTEKSRDMGASWIIFVYVPLWLWLFRDGANLLIGSYKESLVDNRTRDSLFGMIDYAMESLPKWLIPKGFKPEKHRNHMKLINPVNFNQITGDTMNPQFGRGARKTAVLFDELGFWEYAKEAWESTGDVTACRIANSTPNGFNYFAQLRNSGIDVHTIHWRQHPLKDEQWYEFEKERRTSEEVAQELDISYIKSLEGRVYPEWDGGNVEHGLFPYDESLDLYISWDFGRTDDTAIIWSQRTKKGKIRIVDTYRKVGKHIEFFVPFITGIITSNLFDKYTYTPEELKIIDEHSRWRNGTHFGDPSGRFTSQNSDWSIIETLKMNGIHVNARDEWKGHLKRKQATRLMIVQGMELNSNPRTQYFDLCISQAAYPKVRRDGSNEVKSVEPVHNWTSHYRSSLEYLALGLFEWETRRSKVYDKIKPKPQFNQIRTVQY